MQLTTNNEIIEKAKTKKDECYRYQGIAYRVVNHRVTHFADYGTILERAYGFNCVIGEYTFSMNSAEAGQKLLRKIK